MSDTHHTADAQEALPRWAQEDAFALKPDTAAFGYLDTKGKQHLAETEGELEKLLAKSRDGIDLVWTPDAPRLQVPEEVPALHSVLRKRLKQRAERDLSDGLRMSAVFGIALTWAAWSAWMNGGKKFEALYSHQLTGLAAILLLVFGLIPLYEGWKLRRRMSELKNTDLADEIPEARFDSWLAGQKKPITKFLVSLVVLIGLVQIYIDWTHTGQPSIGRAGHLKTPGLAWWRGLTGAMIHGNAIHLLLNLGGLLYLGHRVETIARWPHLVLVFLLSMWSGAAATAYWNPSTPAVGISGGLMGLLGFLLVFEFLHRRLVPRSARRRLLAGLVLMLVIGELGMSFIDNAAHVGGLIFGLLYAAFVFPPTSSPHRPKILVRDKLLGFVSLAILVVIALLTLGLLVGV